jgi:hypothetical protein
VTNNNLNAHRRRWEVECNSDAVKLFSSASASSSIGGPPVLLVAEEEPYTSW